MTGKRIRIAAAAAFLALLAGCGQTDVAEHPSASPGSGGQFAADESGAHTGDAGGNGHAGHAGNEGNAGNAGDGNAGNRQVGGAMPEEATLTFHAVPEEEGALQEMPETADVIKRVATGLGDVLFYAKRADGDDVYGALRTDTGAHELGMVGSRSAAADPSMFAAQERTLNGRAVVRVDGVRGANAPVQIYAFVEDGEARVWLRVDPGHAAEFDFEGDGTSEIVAVHGTPAAAYVYRLSGEAWGVAGLNEALGALSVTPRPDGAFNAQAELGGPAETYDYANGVITRRDAGSP